MNEKIPTILTPEEQEKKDQEDRYEYYMLNHPEQKVSPEDLKESGPKIAEFEEMIVSFECKHSLETLRLITEITPELKKLFLDESDMSVEQIESAINNLTPEDAEKYKTKTAARKDLNLIVKKMNILETETNISPEKYKKLNAKYIILSRAVGIVNGNKVDHDMIGEYMAKVS